MIDVLHKKEENLSFLVAGTLRSVGGFPSLFKPERVHIGTELLFFFCRNWGIRYHEYALILVKVDGFNNSNTIYALLTFSFL